MKNNILDMFTLYHVPAGAVKKIYAEEVIENDEESVVVSADMIEDFSDAEFFEFDKEEYNYYLSSIFRPDEFYGYLIGAYGLRWDGAIGYMKVKDYRDIFNFDYDVNIYHDGSSEDGIFHNFSVSSHDAPMGANYIVIGLDKASYREIDEKSFDEVIGVIDFYRKSYE